MNKCAKNNEPHEIWDRLVLLLITEPRKGWELEFRQITRREIERLAQLSDVEKDDV